MSYIGQTLPTDVFGGYTTDTFAGDGSATTFTLSQAPFNEQGLIVVINNVIQQPTTNYTVSGTTLTIVGTAVASGDVIYARHTGVALPIGEANALDLQGQSDKLILDADADTTISADTDDQIDFKAGGTDVMSMTATGLTINDGTTITTADNSDTLTLVSTDADALSSPNLVLYRNSSSPADGDQLGYIHFDGRNDNSQDVTYAKFLVHTDDVSDGEEDGDVFLQVMTAGSLQNYVSMLAVENQPEVVINDGSIDMDFRVESNGNANMLFVSGGNDVVGIGAEGDLGVGLHVKVADASVSAVNSAADELVLENSASCGLSIFSGTGEVGKIAFGDSGDNNIGEIIYNHSTNKMTFTAGANETLTIEPGGQTNTSSSEHNNTAFEIAHTGDGSSAFPYGMAVRFPNANRDNNVEYFIFCIDSTTTRFRVDADGDTKNHDNSFGSTSDERIKDGIKDANSQWDDIKAVKVRNFKKKDDVRQYGDDAWEQIGVVAQELETVSPKLIRNNNPDPSDILSDSAFGTLYEDGDSIPEGKQIGDVKEIKEQVKSVKYSVLYMKAIKALQEAMAKIETLETKVKALEDA